MSGILNSTPQIPSIQAVLTYSIGGIPLFAYLGIGATTICLAAVTMYDANTNENSSSDNQSFLYSLPKEISTTLNRGDNTQNNSADVQIKGGGKKKKRKASSSKKKTKNSRV